METMLIQPFLHGFDLHYNFSAFGDVGPGVTKQRLRDIWLRRAKANIDLSGNDFSTALSGESSELDINALKLFLGGGLVGLISRTLTSPMERIRLLQQTGGSAAGGAKRILHQIIKQEGIRGIWRGNGANCLKAVPQTALVSMTYGCLIPLLENVDENTDISHYTRLAAGAVAGIFATSVTYPLDIIQAKLCTQLSAAKADSSAKACSGKDGVIRISSLPGLNTSVIARMVSRSYQCQGQQPHIIHCKNALDHMTTLSLVQDQFNIAKNRLKLLKFSWKIRSTIEEMGCIVRAKRLARQKLQNSLANTNYLGIRDTYRKVTAHEGISGLYRGLIPTLAGTASFIAIQLAGFDIFVDRFHDVLDLEEQNAVSTLLASSIAGTVAQTVVHPVDTIRRRIQVAKEKLPESSGFWRTTMSVIRRESWRGLYSGLLSTYAKVVPSVTISLTIREIIFGRLQVY